MGDGEAALKDQGGQLGQCPVYLQKGQRSVGLEDSTQGAGGPGGGEHQSEA